MATYKRILLGLAMTVSFAMFFGLGTEFDVMAQGAQPTGYWLEVINCIGPGVNSPIIHVEVKAKKVNWSGSVYYHKGTERFSSPKPTYNVRATWKKQTIKDQFKPAEPGRVLQVYVNRDSHKRIYFVPVQR
ncbi:MAG: hypothetical protein JW829_16710 [Pirellulales bacterium]|nr:hypothetical protein [Pirellulales bacterium]